MRESHIYNGVFHSSAEQMSRGDLQAIAVHHSIVHHWVGLVEAV